MEYNIEKIKEISKCYNIILENLNQDTNSESLKKTPERAAKALLFFTKGYNINYSGKFSPF